jgi:hypothetical protein
VPGTTWERNNARLFCILVLHNLGAFADMRSLLDESLRDAQQRGDRFAFATLRFLHALALLTVDRPDKARHCVEETVWEPPEGRFHVQHWFQLQAEGERALYQREAGSFCAASEPRFAAMRASLLLRVSTMRAYAASLHGRLWVAAAPSAANPASCYAGAAKCARSLEKERVGYATVLACLLRAGVAAGHRRRPAVDASKFLQRAIEVSEVEGMALHGAAARFRLGHIVGGDRGNELLKAALAYAEREGIVDPAAMFDMVAPGFGDHSPPRTSAEGDLGDIDVDRGQSPPSIGLHL